MTLEIVQNFHLPIRIKAERVGDVDGIVHINVPNVLAINYRFLTLVFKIDVYIGLSSGNKPSDSEAYAIDSDVAAPRELAF